MSTSDGYVVGATKIVDHGPDPDRFNLVIVAESFTAQRQATFQAEAQSLADAFLSTPPINEFRCGINVYRLDVVSDQAGADDPVACGGTGAAPRTYFDATFCADGVIRRLLMVDNALVKSVVKAWVPAWTQIVVLVDTPEYGGSGGEISVSSLNPVWTDVAIHEMGHSIFGLGDEYDFLTACDDNNDVYAGVEPYEPNLAKDIGRDTIKWADLVLPSTNLPTKTNPNQCLTCDMTPNSVPGDPVGAYEGAGWFHCGLYRPQHDCMMRNFQPFCAVCSREVRAELTQYLPDCLAPVFPASSGLACFFKTLVLALALVLLALLLWIPGVQCTFRQTAFRIRHCRSGNEDPCAPL